MRAFDRAEVKAFAAPTPPQNRAHHSVWAKSCQEMRLPFKSLKSIRKAGEKRVIRFVLAVTEAAIAQNTTTRKDPARLGLWLIRLLEALLFVSSMAAVSGMFEAHLLRQLADLSSGSDAALQARAAANDTRQFVIGIVQVAVWIATAITMLVWIHRSNRAARDAGARDMTFTPGWSVGWYFIPIFNFWKPYQAMKEIWKATANPSDWQSQQPPGFLPLWWACWLISLTLGRIAFRLSMRAETLEQLTTANLFTIAADLSDIPLCILGIRLVTGLRDLQMALPPETKSS